MSLKSDHSKYSLEHNTYTLSSAHIFLMKIKSWKTHSGVTGMAINWAELITQRALNGPLSWTIVFDSKLMRNFSITVRRIRACQWWHAHTGTGEQAHSSVLVFFPFHTHTHLPLSCIGWPFPPTPPLCSILFCSAWIWALVWDITSSTRGEGPSIPPSICYSISSTILSRWWGEESKFLWAQRKSSDDL